MTWASGTPTLSDVGYDVSAQPVGRVALNCLTLISSHNVRHKQGIMLILVLEIEKCGVRGVLFLSHLGFPPKQSHCSFLFHVKQFQLEGWDNTVI